MQQGKLILGIDPGSRITGYGILQVELKGLRHITSGCIKTTDEALPLRLQQIFTGISDIIQQFQPNTSAIEEVFFNRYAGAALKLGQARGAAIAALACGGLTVAEYSTRQVKQATVGYGAAAKQQMQHMIRILLKLPEIPEVDAADALAVAVCHAHMGGGLQAMTRGRRYRRARVIV